ncbi:MAG: molybdopterin converting factor subunit 1 [Candidatus Accumulibacter sp.]|jgi:molybdopterin synthase sulfur carrier subunit|uniref:molybdopterin converting factor subunit 1 n=1 Tax=Accumulibacter sp. TaxID=2053492 RepID=UPI002083DDAF|nr:molybdopterin converting factor subunit 1 [Accumulibacter sp.]MBK8115791.1 molybdopterin converting factor subunit 1 [Accumulibacter sp.]MBK8577520.1 molybdopterin converting factor subunit 1 [Candidatus Accumulibacter propinquus]
MRYVSSPSPSCSVKGGQLKILYFASLREALGCGGEEVALPAGVADIAGLMAFLAARDEKSQVLRTRRNLRYAVNQEMARLDTPVADGDEVAFFPPVTGG